MRYAGDLYFEELQPISNRQRSKWNKNRVKAYRGSLRHFLTTLNERFGLRFEIIDGRAVERENWRRISGRRKDPLVKEGFNVLFNKKDLFGTSLIIESDFRPLKNEILVFPDKMRRNRCYHLKVA